MTFDETDLRAGLRALTAAPPPAPPDRAVRSAHRWRRIQVRRAAVATVTAFAVAVPVVALVTRDSAPPVVRVAGTPITQWPDRRLPDYRDEAAAALPSDTAGSPEIRPRWLYAGPVAGTDTVAAVWADCDARTCERVTVAYGPRGSDPRTWPSSSNALRSSELSHPVGWYFPGSHGGTVLFALGPAEARTLTYAVPKGAKGRARNAGGVFTADLGWVGAQPTVRVADGSRRILYEGALGLGDFAAVGYARALPRLTSVPSGYRLVSTGEGQARDRRVEVVSAGSKAYRVFVRCVGSGSVGLLGSIGLDTSIPCDGKVHPGPLEDAVEGGEAKVIIENASDPYAVFAVAVGTPV